MKEELPVRQRIFRRSAIYRKVHGGNSGISHTRKERIPVETKKKELTENEKKKRYLRSYRESVRKIKRIEEEINEIQSMKMSASSFGNDGMPHGRGGGDLSEYAATLDKMERDLVREKNRRIQLYKKISMEIDSVENDNEKDILFYRYVKGKELWEIAELMGFSERHIRRIHGDALEHFKIQKEKMS